MTTGKQTRFRGRTQVVRLAGTCACVAAVTLLAAPAAAQTEYDSSHPQEGFHDDHHSFVGDLDAQAWSHPEPSPMPRDRAGGDADHHTAGHDHGYAAAYPYDGPSGGQYGEPYVSQYGDPYGSPYADQAGYAAGIEFGADRAMGGEIDQVGYFCHQAGGHCDGCGAAPVCCRCIPWWAHRTGAFGQFLLLRPGNTDIIYAIEQDSVLPNDNPTGPIGRVNVDEEAGFRVGFAYALNDCSSLVSSFTRFSGDTADSITATPGNVLFSPVFHPSTDNVGVASGTADALLGIDFQLVDLAFRHKWRACNTYAINWLAGFRYGNLDQDFQARQDMQVPIGTRTLDTEVDFHGFGMLLGADAIKRSLHSGFSMYGRGTTSFLAGDWRGRYRQVDQTTGGGVIGNDYEDFRVTPVLELELGFGWTSKCGHWHLHAGYLTSAWYDAVSTRNYIDAVRAADYRDLQERITFSGLTAGIEGRF